MKQNPNTIKQNPAKTVTQPNPQKKLTTSTSNNKAQKVAQTNPAQAQRSNINKSLQILNKLSLNK